MSMLDGSSLAGVVAPLPLWPRKPTPLDQLQPLETRMSFFSDDDVVVYGDPRGFATSTMTLVISISARAGIGRRVMTTALQTPRQPSRATDDDLLMSVRLTRCPNRRIHEIETHELRPAGPPPRAF